MTVTDVARLLRIEENTVRALARRGELPAKKLGKHWRFLRQEILDSLRSDPPPRPIPRPEGIAAASISQEEASTILGVSVRTVRRMIVGGRLETVQAPSGAKRLARKSVLAAAGSVYVGAESSTDDDVIER